MRMSALTSILFEPEAVTVVVAWARGPITPPAGPVTPTMRTNQEIYDKIDSLSATAGCDCGPWRSGVTSDVGTTLTQFAEAGVGGILHKALIRSGTALAIYDRSGEEGPNGAHKIAELRTASTGEIKEFELNIRYDNGLWYKIIDGSGASAGGCTLSVRVDPQ